ncbi:hypothetical protein RJ640_023081 [Escallonia rubra]|uniref:KIB1-4 beta-propeller domain-containing protein n=1 Tax=Escallonia rubra TaxID=112253 RepID=A0AA88R9Z8_9ASTE|nr:hypothetical protein RJ640_023081 [Escallonia rubra]
MVCVEDGTDRVVVEPTLPPPGRFANGSAFLKLNENQEPADVYKCKTVDFEVFKLLRSNAKARPTWVQIESIGDQALFLGDNHAVCVSTSEFSGCKPNSIYYTEHYFDELGYVPCGTDDDNGVFDLGNRSLELHYVPDPSHKPLLPAIWIVPHFNTINWMMIVPVGVTDMFHWERKFIGDVANQLIRCNPIYKKLESYKLT